MIKNKELEKNRLYDLIQNLSTSDKVYLKKYSKIFISKGETKHKIFYSILGEMKEYSLDTLKKKLEKFGGFRRFRNAEQEIYNQVLEDLVLLKSKKRPTWKYFLEHMKVGYLFFGNQFKESLKHFDVLFKIKEESNNATIDYMYYKYYYHSLSLDNNVRNIEGLEKFKNVEKKLNESIDDLKTEFLSEAAIHNFDIYRFSSFNKTKIQFLDGLHSFKKEYVEVLPKNLVTEKLKMLAVYYYFFCHYAVYTLDFEQLNTYSNLYYKNFNKEKIRNQFSHEYINAINFRILYYISTKDDEVYKLINEFKSYIDDNDFFELKSFHYLVYCQWSLMAYNKLDNIIELKNFIEIHHNTYNKISKSSTTRFTLTTDLHWAVSFFRLKRLKEVQPYLDKIFHTLGNIDEVFNEILISARILDILVHFEYKNYENISYYITNLKNEMKRNNQLLAFDNEFLNHLSKLNQQLFAKQIIEKDIFNDFLKNKEEDRINSYLTVIGVEHWLKELK